MGHKKVDYCVSCYQKYKVELHNKHGSWKDENQPNADIIVVHIGVKNKKCEYCKKPCEAVHP